DRLVSTTTGGALTTSISSANAALSISDETGSGLLVFNNAPTFSTGSVTFSGITSDITTGTNEHFAIMPNGTGNVGIGTTTPGTKFDIWGTSGAYDLFNVASSSGSSLLHVTKAGYVGIGTTTPSARLNSIGTFSVELDVVSEAATGGDISTDGLYTVHTFTTAGTFTFNPGPNVASVSYLVVAGGGGGGTSAAGYGGAGAGGAGGYLASSSYAVSEQNYTVTVGASGAGRTAGSNQAGGNGGNSVFGAITATGGGGGSNYAGNAGNGGSGGGAGYGGGSVGTGISGQGYNGGPVTGFTGGGGGGASGSGTNGSGGSNGGAGTASSITGTSITRAGGGATGTGTATGGGGTSGSINGAANTGGGGFGGYSDGAASGSGGSGVVIVRYLTPTGTTRVNRINVASSGNVGIGTTTPAGIFDVKGKLTVLSAGSVGVNTTTPSVALDVVGDVEYTGTITDVSDARLKENFSDFDGALRIINSIGVKNYNMIDTPDRIETGFIAQDMQQVFPQAVSVVDPINGYLGVSYVSFIPVLARGVQELNSRTTQQVSADDLSIGDLVSYASGSSAFRVAMGSTDQAVVAGVVTDVAGADVYGVASTSISFSGKALVKVSLENGAIEPGDRLALSPTQPGVAVRALSSGMTIGMALDSVDTIPSGSYAKIQVYVNPTYWSPSLALTSGTVADGTASGSADVTVTSTTTDSVASVSQVIDAIKNSIFTEVQTLWAKKDVIAEGIKKTYYAIADLIPGVDVSSWLSRDTTISDQADATTKSMFEGNGAQASKESKLEMDENGNYLTTYGVDSTRGEIQLTGSGDLVNGEAKVFFDYSFTSIISDQVVLRVLITPTTVGVTGQLYVDQKTIYGFTVKELNGSSTGKFDWMIIARRKGFEDKVAPTPTPTPDATGTTSVPPAEVTPTPTPDPSAPTGDTTTPTPTPTPDATPIVESPAPTPDASVPETPTPTPVPAELPAEPTPAPTEPEIVPAP
ncbi:MAG: hypothetical protein A2371_02730, partial [Candidatus Yanofskybacteria bacterium RIFOXYB1_FULL_44_29]